MATAASRFQVGEELALAGKPMKVAGLVQYDTGSEAITRYTLAGDAGAAVILQEEGGAHAILRPFPPAAAPVAEGSTVTVVGEKYALAGVRKLKTIAASGQHAAELANAPLVLSGVFKGNMGTLLREVVPGAAAQSYFLVKQIARNELLNGAELAQQLEAERIVAELNAQAAESEADESEQKPLAKIGSWVVAILVIVALVWACSGDDDDSSSSGSVRVGTGSHSHGGK
jgi:hypothetical protein